VSQIEKVCTDTISNSLHSGYDAQLATREFAHEYQRLRKEILLVQGTALQL